MRPFKVIRKAKRTQLIENLVYPAAVKVSFANSYVYAMPTCQMQGKKLRYTAKCTVAHSQPLVEFTCNILVKPWVA